MRAKINKSLDLNKLYEDQAKGELLKKILQFPLIASTKYDGNYVVVRRQDGRTTYLTSGGLDYIHADDCTTFDNVVDGIYLAERIGGLGKLGDRTKCNLRGPKVAQTSTGHSYMVFDFITLEDYAKGKTSIPYIDRLVTLQHSGVNLINIVATRTINNKEELDDTLKVVINNGYEGLMLASLDWKWNDSKSRKVNFCKYKKRRTADLLVIDTNEGEGKYEGMVGSLVLTDSRGTICSVGSGLGDGDRLRSDWVGKVVEIKYEQIIDTYIQPTFIRVRDDKTDKDID